MLKLRYEWANFKHLRDRNQAAGVTSSIIDKVLHCMSQYAAWRDLLMHDMLHAAGSVRVPAGGGVPPRGPRPNSLRQGAIPDDPGVAS